MRKILVELVLFGETAEDYADMDDEMLVEKFLITDTNLYHIRNGDYEINLVSEPFNKEGL
jgi:hypothetical protein